MAEMTEQEKREALIYRKVAATWMVMLHVFGLLQLWGVIKV